ncbi:MAG: tripartite tricarboxylate transporter TctB family protein [Nitrospinota bacterium]
MRTRNIAAGLGFLALGVIYAYMTAQLPLRVVGNVPGPSFFPWVLTWCFLGLSGVLLIQGLMAPAGQSPRPASDRKIFRRTAAGLASMALYLALLPYLGFLVASALLCGALMWAAGESRPGFIAGWSVAVTALLYAMFRYAFQLPLPTILGP